MFIERPAAEIEPSLAMRSSSATLPGPSRPSWSKSMLMLRRGITALLRYALLRQTRLTLRRRVAPSRRVGLRRVCCPPQRGGYSARSRRALRALLRMRLWASGWSGHDLASLERHALDHGIDRPARRQRQPLHRLGGQSRRQVGAVAIQPDVG